MSPRVHGDMHALWIDPKDPRRIWQGNDGGLAVTYDAGHSWEQINNIPLGQFYHVSADERKPFYNVTVGMQDKGAWTGPSRTREPAGIFNDDWRMLTPYTGFNSLAVSSDPDIIISERPGGALSRIDTRTREQQSVSPQAQNYGGSPASEMKYRFNWDAPLIGSPHGRETIYLAGNVIFQSSNFGKSWETISKDLTTDDGNLRVTTDGGGNWKNVAPNVTGLPAHSPISHVEPSHFAAQTIYVSADRHMFDDMDPYIFKSAGGGKTWSKIGDGLPEKAFVWIIREDPRQAKLLYAGTEFGLYATFDGGANWIPPHMKHLPWAISVRDIVSRRRRTIC